MPGYSRSCRRFIILATMFTVATVPVLTAQAALSSSDQKVLAQFSKDARNYVDKEHSLSASKMKPTTDVAKLEDQRRQLRDAIQQSRLNAKQGDLFTPATAQVFRGILRNLLSGPEGAKIKVSLNHAEPSAPPAFKVNGTFPNQDGQPIQSVPATVLKVLPGLPEGLEYCIAGKTLALHDSRASMVVDFLPDALP